jgi:hypothetical protein
MAFGETDYLNHHVYGGIGRKFISPETITFLATQKSVADTECRDAVAVAMNIIEATSKATTHVPASSGIGGPVDVVILGDEPCAHKLHWKS